MFNKLSNDKTLEIVIMCLLFYMLKSNTIKSEFYITYLWIIYNIIPLKINS